MPDCASSGRWSRRRRYRPGSSCPAYADDPRLSGPAHGTSLPIMDNGTRDELLGRLTEAIESVTTAHPVRVAVDGRPAAGKTTLADDLAVILQNRGRQVI